MTGHDELIETVEVHIKWLRHTPPCACDSHDVDNRQSADYLERLVAVGHAFAAKVEELRADATTLAEARQLAARLGQRIDDQGHPVDREATVGALLDLLAGWDLTRKATEHQGPYPFVLVRDEDVTGVSGTGIVAEGVEFTGPDGVGVVALRWLSEWPTSVVFHDRGVDSVLAVHGHGGKTRLEWR